MIQFACDSCQRVKGSKEVWILGYAAESMGLTAAQREITVLPIWDADRAVHPLAVHFCSKRCKEDYRARLFGEPSTLLHSTRRKATATARAKPRSGKRKSSKSGGRKWLRRKRAA